VVGTNSAAVDLKQLREHLRKRLPEYMIPSAFRDLEDTTTQSNGKVDRTALPAPQLNGEGTGIATGHRGRRGGGLASALA